MKKIIFPMLALSLMALCFPGNVKAQSSEQELDQVELMKQFIGKWITDVGEDSTFVWEVIPWGEGYEQMANWQAKGETYSTIKGIIGFTSKYRKVNSHWLMTNGMMIRQLGDFVSDKNLIFELFNSKYDHVMGTYDFLFITPDKFEMIYKNRGMKDTWDDAFVMEYTWTRVK
jgi:hypothetical protein